MLTANPPGRPDFQQELLAIRNDPKIRNLAWQRAGDPDLAIDGLQAAYCAVARVADPTAIRNLRAYFCQVLTREIYRLLGQLRATLVEDFTSLADIHQGRPGGLLPMPQSVAETVSTHLLAAAWLEPFATHRAKLTASVPGRSPDPGRYRAMIVTVAEHVLRAIIVEDISDADYNTALRAAYPEWFGEPGYPENTYHQRFSRARADVRALLRTIINPDDLNY
jgi:DNA-directed RNA polymerase specialized sigma24 family protein